MTQNKTDEYWMQLALESAESAATIGEVPIGAVLVKGDQLITQGHNQRELKQSPSAHAELLVIETASQKLKSWRLLETKLYVTLEPCMMCWGAIILSRIPQIIYGARDPKAGVCGSILSLHEETRFNHLPEVQSGILAEKCGQILSNFFLKLRSKKVLASPEKPGSKASQ